MYPTGTLFGKLGSSCNRSPFGERSGSLAPCGRPGEDVPDHGQVVQPAAEQALVLVVSEIGVGEFHQGDAVTREEVAAALIGPPNEFGV